MNHKLKILLIGLGGREDALYRAMQKSPLVERVIWAPGNGGCRPEDRRDVNVSDVYDILALAQKERPDLVVIGPEAPLIRGVADTLREAGICVFGPCKEAAQLEGSKIFAKHFCSRCGIPTADYVTVCDIRAGYAAVQDLKRPVIKLDGPYAGKEVVIPENKSLAEEMVYNIFTHRCFGPENADLRDTPLRFVFEECLTGYEYSVTVICDSKDFVLLPVVHDCKPAYAGGPNTGGMGGYYPISYLDDAILAQIKDKIIVPTIRKMRDAGSPYRGAIKFDLMITDKGPYLLEFNVRMGDPETQLIVSLLMYSGIDIVPYMWATLEEGGLASMAPIVLKPCIAAVSTVIASEGYPGTYETGNPIEGIEVAQAIPNVQVFEAGVENTPNGKRTTGGRILCVTGIGSTIEQARLTSLRGVDAITAPHSFHRRDIGIGV